MNSEQKTEVLVKMVKVVLADEGKLNQEDIGRISSRYNSGKDSVEFFWQDDQGQQQRICSFSLRHPRIGRGNGSLPEKIVEAYSILAAWFLASTPPGAFEVYGSDESRDFN